MKRRDFLKAVGATTVLLAGSNSLSLAADAGPAKADDKGKLLEGGERGFVVQDAGYFPVLIRTNDGNLAAVFRAGAPHIGVGGRLDFARSSDGGKTWSKAQPIVYMPPDSRNPAFGQAPDGTLVLSWSVTGPYPKGKWQPPLSTSYTVWLSWSDDGGASWMPPKQLPLEGWEFGSPFGKIVTMKEGTMLMAVYQWAKRGEYQSNIYRSTDQGRTWDKPTMIADNHNETALVVLSDQSVLALARTPAGGLSECLSKDGGKTWSDAKPLTDKTLHPADVIVLESGRLLLTFGRRTAPFGVEAVLGDFKDGQVKWAWETRRLLEDQAVNTDCGYPSSVQLKDGTLVTISYAVGRKDEKAKGPCCSWLRYSESGFKG